MLEDSGRPAEAEAAYSSVLAQTPEDADLHLQLGHALKLQGRRPEALAAYRRSAEVQPSRATAVRELFEAGCPRTHAEVVGPPMGTGPNETPIANTRAIAPF